MERRALTRIASNVGSVKLPPHVSIKGNTFTLVDDAGNQMKVGSELNCVVVDINENGSRMYWGDRVYDENRPEPPLCFSDNGIAPSVRAEEPQAVSCKPDRTHTFGCKWATWESGVSKLTGKNVPACQEGVKLALLMVKAKGKEWVPLFPKIAVFFLRVPPASLGAVAAYGRSVAGLGKVSGLPSQQGEEITCDLPYVITQVSFVGTGKLGFKAIGYISEQIDKVIDEIEPEKVDVAVGRDDEPIIGALPAPNEDSVGLRAITNVLKEQNDQMRAASLPTEPQPTIAAPVARTRGRPRKENAPAAPAAKPGGIRERAEPGFQPREDNRFVTGQDVRDHAEIERQEGIEAFAAEAERQKKEGEEKFGVVESAPEPPEDVLDQFMGLELK